MPGRRILHDGRLDGAMHEQVRITTDGRSEMRVLFERQAEVTDIGLLIHGLSQRTDHQALEHEAVGPRGQPFHQLAEFTRRRLLREHRAHLQGIQYLLQLGDALVFRLAVDAIQTPDLRQAQSHRRFDIGGDHALLDQAMRVVARHGVKSLDAAVGADARLDLATAKVQRAACVARFLERAVNGIQRLQ